MITHPARIEWYLLTPLMRRVTGKGATLSPRLRPTRRLKAGRPDMF
jgi:hypothetical protein